MAELFASLPLGHRPAPGRYGAPATPPGVSIAVLESSVATLIARPGRVTAAVARLAAHFGVAPIDAPVRTDLDGIALVGIAPGRWTAVSSEPPEVLVETLEAALGDDGFVVDQSGGQVVLALDGPKLPDLLASLVAIDLDPAVAPAAAAPTTVIDHLGATLLPGATSSERRLIVGRSSLAAGLRLIVATAASHGCELV